MIVTFGTIELLQCSVRFQFHIENDSNQSDRKRHTVHRWFHLHFLETTDIFTVFKWLLIDIHCAIDHLKYTVLSHTDRVVVVVLFFLALRSRFTSITNRARHHSNNDDYDYNFDCMDNLLEIETCSSISVRNENHLKTEPFAQSHIDSFGQNETNAKFIRWQKSARISLHFPPGICFFFLVAPYDVNVPHHSAQSVVENGLNFHFGWRRWTCAPYFEFR